MRRYVYALAAATIMSVAMPVMAEETSTEEETSIEVDSTEESGTGEDRASEIEKLIQQLEKQIAELKAELKSLRGEDATVEGDIVYQDDSVIVTYNGLKENEYGDGYTINFIIENLTDKKINVGYDDESINGFMCYTGFYADIVAGKKTKEVIDMYEDSDDYCPMEELESLEFCVVVSDADTYDEISTSDPVVINFAN